MLAETILTMFRGAIRKERGSLLYAGEFGCNSMVSGDPVVFHFGT
jgi:hypothetical protein